MVPLSVVAPIVVTAVGANIPDKPHNCSAGAATGWSDRSDGRYDAYPDHIVRVDLVAPNRDVLATWPTSTLRSQLQKQRENIASAVWLRTKLICHKGGHF